MEPLELDNVVDWPLKDRMVLLDWSSMSIATCDLATARPSAVPGLDSMPSAVSQPCKRARVRTTVSQRCKRQQAQLQSLNERNARLKRALAEAHPQVVVLKSLVANLFFSQERGAVDLQLPMFTVETLS